MFYNISKSSIQNTCEIAIYPANTEQVIVRKFQNLVLVEYLPYLQYLSYRYESNAFNTYNYLNFPGSDDKAID